METKRLVITDVWGQQRVFSGSLVEKYGMAVLLREARADGLKTIQRIEVEVPNDGWLLWRCETTVFNINRDGYLGSGGGLCNTPPYNYKSRKTT